MPRPLRILAFLGSALLASAQETSPLPGTRPLTLTGDLSAQMVAGIDKFLRVEIDRSVTNRQAWWHRDFSSPEAYEKSVANNREHLRRMIGAVDSRVGVASLELIGSTATPSTVAETPLFSIHTVRWPVFEGVFGEGLWLRPKAPPLAHIVALPDADQTPEMLAGLAPGLPGERQYARRLAENGCEVLIPVLIDRQDTWSGNPRINRLTNQPHREWIYRPAFELGRHIIGYEVQKALAAVDFFSLPGPGAGRAPIGLVGYGEGGLVALHAAALDSRVDAALVSGYFDSRQRLWEEPIYRNVFGLLREFGDAEIATLVAPRGLVIEHSTVPKVDGPPPPRDGRQGAAPGKLVTPDYESVEREFARARLLLKGGAARPERFSFISGTEGMTTGPVSDRALSAFLAALGMPQAQLKPSGQAPADQRTNFDPGPRQHRQVKELEDFTQKLLRESEAARGKYFWGKVKAGNPEAYLAACAPFKTAFHEEVIGKWSATDVPTNPRARLIAGSAVTNWTGYEVVLDVLPEVFAWGYLLVPKNIPPGEHRPVVVCQHGLEGVPADVISKDSSSQAFGYYKAFAARLAEQGFVVFAPHNPYRGGSKFRQLQRQSNPLGKTLFSIIIAQHERVLDWLSELPFVDAGRIGFYGLSYGGKTAMRVPAAIERYALSICSGDFNEWVYKNASVDFPISYLYTDEYEMPEFDLGHTFNYAEMAALIAPRPFMVERGHNDGVGVDELVSYEYAKVRRLYDQLGIGDRTTIEYFNGPHTINGAGTFEFLKKHLNWPGR